MAMPNDNLLKYGILKCRDLVALYYGAYMVMVPKETLYVVGTTAPTQILSQDPRRIKYEIAVTPQTAPDDISIATSLDASQNFLGMDYEVPDTTVLIIERSFLSDGDSVTLPLWAMGDTTSWSVTVREIFLSTAPVDETPLG
jgi:hypothetical protein